MNTYDKRQPAPKEVTEMALAKLPLEQKAEAIIRDNTAPSSADLILSTFGINGKSSNNTSTTDHSAALSKALSDVMYRRGH